MNTRMIRNIACHLERSREVELIDQDTASLDSARDDWTNRS